MLIHDPNTVIADHVIQVNLIFRKSFTQVRGSINVWKKAGMFGLGDDLMRWCPRPKCLGLIEFGFELFPEEEERIGDVANIAIRDWPEDIRKRHDTWYESMHKCPECSVPSPRMMYCDSYGFNTTLDVVSRRMADIFRKLGSNSDVYLVRTVEDKLIHKANAELRETVKPDMARYVKLLEKARDREQVFYPLKKIIKDTQSGSLEKRFLALLRS